MTNVSHCFPKMHRINDNYSDAKYIIMALFEQCQLHSVGPYIPQPITNLMVIIIIIQKPLSVVPSTAYSVAYSTRIRRSVIATHYICLCVALMHCCDISIELEEI